MADHEQQIKCRTLAPREARPTRVGLDRHRGSGIGIGIGIGHEYSSQEEVTRLPRTSTTRPTATA
jgi:hypothetical protein